MKTAVLEPRTDVAAIVQLNDAGDGEVHDAGIVERARAFAEPWLRGQPLETGEDSLAHADAVAQLLNGIGAAAELRAAVYLAYAADYIDRGEDAIGKQFGATFALLVDNTRKLVQLLRSARDAPVGAAQRSLQTERIRKMLLAFSRDLRVVLLRLASRLQTLRFYAASKLPCPSALAAESLHVFAPLANRLGIGQWKWELEDLSFRFLEPEPYKAISELLDERRVEREQGIEAFRAGLHRDLAEQGIRAHVSGRPKHLCSIWKKMQAKGLQFAAVFDVRALRVIVDTVPDCYAVLARVHALYPTVAGEFDDYIERPKANGYQSLHTVVLDAQGRAVEVQIRTRQMHEQAEHGGAAHWAYKESLGRPGSAANAATLAAQVTEARKTVLRQLLAWERDLAEQGAGAADPADERIYVFTPQANVVELPAGATPIDFAYAVHTDLGHRCRGAKVDSVMVPLNTALRSGQTVEINALKEGGPSLDWLNPELGYLKSARSKSKVRAWFNLLAQRDTIARGREAVEKLLQREGKTALKLDDLATQLGFRSADALFEAVGKDEFSLRSIEVLLRPVAPLPSADEAAALKHARARPQTAKGGVLVVGVDSLMTSLARCCRPAPPDAIGGYVTRGKGVGIHRLSCANFKQMVARSPERTIPVAWDQSRAEGAVYAVDVAIEADDRQGLLRDVSEVFAKEKVNVIGVRSESVKGPRQGTAFMTFTIEVPSSARLAGVLGLAAKVNGVRTARRK
jgi:GTP pyrophosphokinase